MTTIERPVQGFAIENSVLIGLDALDLATRSAISRILESREAFLAHVNQPPGGRRLAPASRFWQVDAPADLRIVYTDDHGIITVEALMLREVLDHFGPSRRDTGASPNVLESRVIPG